MRQRVLIVMALVTRALAALGAEARGQTSPRTGIIARTGARYYPVAAAPARIVEAIVRDQHTVFAVASLLNDNAYGISDGCSSVPAVLSRGGVERLLRLDLSPSELERLRDSSGVLRTAIAQLGLENL